MVLAQLAAVRRHCCVNQDIRAFSGPDYSTQFIQGYKSNDGQKQREDECATCYRYRRYSNREFAKKGVLMDRNSWIKELIVTARYNIISFLVVQGILFPLSAPSSLGCDGGMPRKRFSFFKQLAGVGCSCFRLHSFFWRRYNAVEISGVAYPDNGPSGVKLVSRYRPGKTK